jgi:hypothetical protein
MKGLSAEEVVRMGKCRMKTGYCVWLAVASKVVL